VARLAKLRNANPGNKDTAEYALLVSDKYQHQGIGKELMMRILAIAKDEKIGIIYGFVLEENVEMIALAERLGFVATPSEREQITRVELILA